MGCEIIRKRVIFLVLLFSATAFANPVGFPDENLKLVVVLGSTFAAEAALVAVILFFCHMAIVPSFVAMFTGNLLMYFIIFRPVLGVTHSVPVAESVIVAAEAVFIRLISKVGSLQEEDFKGLKWRTAFVCATVGNVLSYYVGTVIVG
jgi:hypothetical protein